MEGQMRRYISIFLILCLFSTSGCQSLRKKFTRKRKREKETPVYVDFKEYSEVPSREAYLDYYLFVRGWLDEAIEALQKGTSFKRFKRSMDEAVMNLEQIIAFLNRDGKEYIYPMYEELTSVRQEVTANMSKNRRSVYVRRLESLKREFEREFNYIAAEKWMG